MPTINTWKAPKSESLLWRIDEPIEALITALPTLEVERLLQRVKHPETLRHKLGARRALKALFEANNLEYRGVQKNENGVPLHANFSLSLSHKGGFALAQLSKKESVGVDLEFAENKKAQRLAAKFLHPTELLAWQEDVRRCSQAWAAKEALYKMLRMPGIHFAEQLRLFPETEARWRAEIYLKKRKLQTYVYFKREQHLLMAFSEMA